MKTDLGLDADRDIEFGVAVCVGNDVAVDAYAMYYNGRAYATDAETNDDDSIQEADKKQNRNTDHDEAHMDRIHYHWRPYNRNR